MPTKGTESAGFNGSQQCLIILLSCFGGRTSGTQHGEEGKGREGNGTEGEDDAELEKWRDRERCLKMTHSRFTRAKTWQRARRG